MSPSHTEFTGEAAQWRQSVVLLLKKDKRVNLNLFVVFALMSLPASTYNTVILESKVEFRSMDL